MSNFNDDGLSDESRQRLREIGEASHGPHLSNLFPCYDEILEAIENFFDDCWSIDWVRAVQKMTKEKGTLDNSLDTLYGMPPKEYHQKFVSPMQEEIASKIESVNPVLGLAALVYHSVGETVMHPGNRLERLISKRVTEYISKPEVFARMLGISDSFLAYIKHGSVNEGQCLGKQEEFNEGPEITTLITENHDQYLAGRRLGNRLVGNPAQYTLIHY